MTDKHTPEPWSVRELGDDCFITAAIEPGMAYGPEIMGDDYTGYGDEKRKKADARRIVACVNACAEISTERLEKFLGATANKSVITLTTDNIDFKQQIDQLTKQRDDLLESLETVMSWIDNWNPEFTYDEEWPTDRYKARAAIAAVKDKP